MFYTKKNKDLQSEKNHILKFVNSYNILQDIVYAPKITVIFGADCSGCLY